MTITSVALQLIFGLYVAGLIVFGIFVSREQESSNAKVGVWIGIVSAVILAFLWTAVGLGMMVAACFYVADKKNRSRMWAILGLLIGPIALLLLVALPKLDAGDSLSLSLNSWSESSAPPPPPQGGPPIEK
jgi:RsiW-degrading membrane proteinase PrsW (M82 family)